MHTPPDTHIGDTGPFDLIGDVHGCAAELEILLARLGYSVAIQGPEGFRSYTISHPAGRKPVFLGDLVDRGPRSMDVLRLVMNVLDTGLGYCVAGNHDDKFLRWMKGRAVQLTHGIELSIAQLLMQPDGFREQAETLLENLPHHLILDNGRLLVSHAGLREDLHGRTDTQTRAFALYGAVSKERDEYGFAIRLNWAADYSGQPHIVHGHVAKRDVREQNRVFCIDTGCVFGGHLTAMRWPEREIVQVPALQPYFHSPNW